MQDIQVSEVRCNYPEPKKKRKTESVLNIYTNINGLKKQTVMSAAQCCGLPSSRRRPLAVTAARTWPLTAHQPEPVFMEAEKDEALLEDQACLCWISDAALLSDAGMLIR